LEVQGFIKWAKKNLDSGIVFFAAQIAQVGTGPYVLNTYPRGLAAQPQEYPIVYSAGLTRSYDMHMHIFRVHVFTRQANYDKGYNLKLYTLLEVGLDNHGRVIVDSITGPYRHRGDVTT